VKVVVGCRRREEEEKRVKGDGCQIYEGRLLKVVGMAGGSTLAFASIASLHHPVLAETSGLRWLGNAGGWP